MTLVPNLNGPGSPIYDELVAIKGNPCDPPAYHVPALLPGMVPGVYPVPAGAYADQLGRVLAPEVIAGLFANAPRDGSPWVAVLLFGGGAAQQIQQYGFSGPYPSAPDYGYHVAPHYPAAYQAGAGSYQAPAALPYEAGALEQARYAPVPALPPSPAPPPASAERTRQINGLGPGYSGGFAAMTGLGEQAPAQAQAQSYEQDRAEQLFRQQEQLYARAARANTPEPVWPEEDEQEAAAQDAGSRRGGWLSSRFGGARREFRGR